MLDQLVLDFVRTSYTPELSEAIINTNQTTQEFYNNYDQGPLIGIVADFDQSERVSVADRLHEHVVNEARVLLSVHGISVNESALLSELNYILSTILLAEHHEDKDRLKELVDGVNDNELILANLVGELTEADPTIIYVIEDVGESFITKLKSVVLNDVEYVEDNSIYITQLNKFNDNHPGTVGFELANDIGIQYGMPIFYYSLIMEDYIRGHEEHDPTKMALDILSLSLLSSTDNDVILENSIATANRLYKQDSSLPKIIRILRTFDLDGLFPGEQDEQD